MAFVEGLGSTISSVASGVARGAPAISRIGPSVGPSFGPSVSIGPSLGRIEASLNTMFGPRLSAPNFGISRPAEILPGFKSMWRPEKVPDAGGIFKPGELSTFGFKQLKPELNTAQVVAEAEAIIAQARKPVVKPHIDEPAPRTQVDTIVHKYESVKPIVPVWIEPQVEPAAMPLRVEVPKLMPRIVVIPSWEPVLQPKEVTELAVLAASQTTAETAGKITQSVSINPAPEEQEAEQKETEEVAEEVVRQELTEKLEEEKVIKRKKYLVDYPVLVIVLAEVGEAIEKAIQEVKRQGLKEKILGTLVAKFLPRQHEGNTGGAVKPHGADGTIAARKEAIAAKKEFSSRKEVKAVVDTLRPVTTGENGEEASRVEVSTTFRDRVVKVPKVVEIVIKRLVKEKAVAAKQGPTQAPIFIEQKVQPRTEPTLEDLGLEEVFQKAA